MDLRNGYQSAYTGRYASKEMQYLFSDNYKFRSWRKMWIALAKVEKKLGLDISQEQIDELEAHKDDINYDVARAREKEVRHDVMSHVYAYGKLSPKAAPIIHLGATSCYVTDNTELIQMKDAAELVMKKASQVIFNLSNFAEKYKSMACLAFTHLQPAQPTSVGKRACLWIREFLLAMQDLEDKLNHFELRGAKGATGSQASFLELFEGDVEKVKKLDNEIAKELGFNKTMPISGQTYSRQVDFQILSALASFAIAASKMGNDIRILQAFEEIEEPFETHQIGSSAMPYKRNPMRSERMCSLARNVMVNVLNPAITASCQFFERTLDDSANRRISISEAFLGVDAILNIAINVTDNIQVYDKVINRRLMEKLPYMAIESILMEAVKKGQSRQEVHEKLREHSHAATKKVKLEGGKNDLIDRIAEDPSINLSKNEILLHMDPQKYIGLCPLQVEEYINGPVKEVLNKYHTVEVKEELSI